jgi:hypothetical protein
MPHEITEKIPSTASTNFEIGLEFTMISRKADPEVDGKQCSVKLNAKRRWDSAYRGGTPDIWPGRVPGLMRKTVSRREIAVKHMLRLDFSLFS